GRARHRIPNPARRVWTLADDGRSHPGQHLRAEGPFRVPCSEGGRLGPSAGARGEHASSCSCRTGALFSRRMVRKRLAPIVLLAVFVLVLALPLPFAARIAGLAILAIVVTLDYRAFAARTNAS